MEYKKTLNMTKSGFPMRAGLPVREPDMLKRATEQGVNIIATKLDSFSASVKIAALL